LAGIIFILLVDLQRDIQRSIWFTDTIMTGDLISFSLGRIAVYRGIPMLLTSSSHLGRLSCTFWMVQRSAAILFSWTRLRLITGFHRLSKRDCMG
jgi:hypothetical protein